MIIPVPMGYSGALTAPQADAVAAFKEVMSKFAEEQEEAAASRKTDTENCPPEESAADADPMSPIVPGTAGEEAAEARSILNSESDMTRFLRARQWDVSKATDLCIADCKWRASVKPLSITPEMIPGPMAMGNMRMCGYTKSGMPVLLSEAAKWKPSQLKDLDECMRYVTYHNETTVQRMGPGVERMFVVFVMAGFDKEHMTSFATSCTNVLISVAQEHYPERLGAAILCNAPLIFRAFWKIIRPWIDPVTYSKVHFAGADFSDKLLEYIASEQLPESLGGSHSEYPVPSQSILDEIEATYGAGGRGRFPAASDVTAVTGLTGNTILSGSVSYTHSGEVDIVVRGNAKLEVAIEANTRSVTWNFKTSAHDIAFGYVMTDTSASASSSNGEAPVLPSKEPERMASSSEGVTGSLSVEKAWSGSTLELIFDNSYAMIRGKHVIYEITIVAD